MDGISDVKLNKLLETAENQHMTEDVDAEKKDQRSKL